MIKIKDVVKDLLKEGYTKNEVLETMQYLFYFKKQERQKNKKIKKGL